MISANITFPKLQSLKLRHPTNVDFLKMSPITTLKCFTLSSSKENMINTFIQDAMCKQLALEYVTIINNSAVNSFSILQKIESSLVEKRNTKRKYKRFCIKIKFDHVWLNRERYSNDDNNEFGLQICRVSNVLKSSNIDKWCLSINHEYHNFDKELLENDFDELKRNYFVVYHIGQHSLTAKIQTQG